MNLVQRFDLPGFLRRLSALFLQTESSDLALRGLRVHAHVFGERLEPATLDCSRRVPSVELGHAGSAHLVVHVDARALVPLLAAHSMRDIFTEFNQGLIRLQQGAPGQGPLYTVLRLVRDPLVVRENTDLRAKIQAAFDASSCISSASTVLTPPVHESAGEGGA